MATTQVAASSDYPVQFSVDYPDRPLNRLTTFFRLFMLIPILIVLAALTAGFVSTGGWQNDGDKDAMYYNAGFALAGLLFLAPLLLILFRQKYPQWWFNWNLELMRFQNRINAYGALLRDEYPSTDERQAVHLDIRYPDASRELNRFLPLVKWILAIPHVVVLFFLGIAAFVVIVIAWFAILFTGRYPRGLFDFVVEVLRWSNRVTAYAVTLMTDRYPPFRLSP